MGAFGIWEPRADLPALDLNEAQMILVPGVAFGESGERIGMGAGFYDRTLASVQQGLRVALTFDFQLFPSLEQNPWDCSMDWIVTEKREMRNSKANAWLNGMK